MATKKKDQTEAGIEGFESALTKTEQYIEDNQKSLTIIVLAITVIVVGKKPFFSQSCFIYILPESPAGSHLNLLLRRG